MRRSTAPCIFGTVAKKCRVPLEELLCFCRFVRNFCGFEKWQSFFTEISYKETQPGRFLAQILLANLRRFDMLRAENNISNNGRKC